MALLFSMAVYAAAPYSGDSLQKLYLEMKYLYQTGVDIHLRYDPTDREQLKACTNEHGYISTRAKSLVGIANRLNHPAKEKLIDAAWQAYSCVKCSSSMSSCEAIPEELKKIKNIMATEYKEKNLTQE